MCLLTILLCSYAGVYKGICEALILYVKLYCLLLGLF
jgi:hypothetical protein